MRAIAVAWTLMLACSHKEQAPPPPPAANPPIRGAAADADLRVLIADLASAKACEMIRGQFRGLRDAQRTGVATGVLWIRECTITNAGTDVTFHLRGSGWQWAAQGKRVAGGRFGIAQDVRFDVDVVMPGSLDIAYDRSSHVVSMWFTPRGEPQIDFKPIGDFWVDRKGVWSSVVGALGTVFAHSPEDLATQDAKKQGTHQFVATLADGLAVTVDLCTGLSRFNLGRRAKGQMQPADVGETKRVPVELQPGALALAGPQLAKHGMTVHAEAIEGAAHLVLACAQDAEPVAQAFLEERTVPPKFVLGQIDVRGRTAVHIEPVSCPVVALATPLDGKPAVLSWLRLPSEIARETGGPVLACR